MSESGKIGIIAEAVNSALSTYDEKRITPLVAEVNRLKRRVEELARALESVNQLRSLILSLNDRVIFNSIKAIGEVQLSAKVDEIGKRVADSVADSVRQALEGVVDDIVQRIQETLQQAPAQGATAQGVQIDYEKLKGEVIEALKEELDKKLDSSFSAFVIQVRKEISDVKDTLKDFEKKLRDTRISVDGFDSALSNIMSSMERLKKDINIVKSLLGASSPARSGGELGGEVEEEVIEGEEEEEEGEEAE